MSKLMSLAEAISLNVHDGDFIALEGFTHLIPFAAGHEIIRQKTATLVAACCASGAASVARNEMDIKRMHEFGTLTGMAFQIKDDLFDYGNDDSIGKPTGIDLREKKMTLPLIYALSKVNWLEKRRIIRLIKYKSEDIESIENVIRFVKEKGGISYAEKVMNEYKEKVIERS